MLLWLDSIRYADNQPFDIIGISEFGDDRMTINKRQPTHQSTVHTYYRLKQKQIAKHRLLAG